MKFAVRAVLGMALVFASPAFAAATAAAAPVAAVTPAHVAAVQDLLGAMQIEKTLWGVAARSRYQNEAQRKAVFAKIDKVPAAEVYQRLAPALAQAISPATALEMTRFYRTPYGKQVIHKNYNSTAQIMLPGMRSTVPVEEQKERKRAAYVRASAELAAAQPAIEREAFKLVQLINGEKR